MQNKENFITKSKLSRSIPLGNDLLFLLERRKLREGQEEGFDFSDAGKPMSSKRVSKQFKNYVKNSGLDPSLHFHSRRHPFCSNLVRAGVSLYIVQRLAGHSSPTVTQRFSHEKKPRIIPGLTFSFACLPLTCGSCSGRGVSALIPLRDIMLTAAMRSPSISTKPISLS